MRNLCTRLRPRPLARGVRPSSRMPAAPRASSNPLQSALAGLSSMFGGESAAAPSSAASRPLASVFTDVAPAWDELASLIAEAGYTPPSMEEGPPNVLSLSRTFGSTSSPPRVTLYRDHAAWCPYCEKVLLQLELKRIPYTVVKEAMRCYGPKTPEYLAKVPSGLLPALELDGRLITESAVIADLLEAAFPDHRPLVPTDPQRVARHAALLRLERRLFGDWLGWLVQGYGRDAFYSTIGLVNDALASAPDGGPFFNGTEITQADVVFAPFLERIAASIPYYKGEMVRGTGAWPALDTWFNAMDALPEFISIRSDAYTHVHDLPPQLGGCIETGTPAQRAAAAAIDGTDGAAWRLPLPPLASDPFDPWPGEDPPADRLRAAARLVGNHAAVTKFAARGSAPPGRPRVGAPLADPFALPDEPALPAVDAALRHVAHALLVGVEAKQSGMHALSVAASGQGVDATKAVAAARYLRDRVGVPRDLPLPAARQLRAHLNWFIDGVSV